MSVAPVISGTSRSSAAKDWLRALERTSAIHRAPTRLLSGVVDEVAERNPDAPALLSDRESFTYRVLSERSHQYARWALGQGIGKGDVVGLLMSNRPEFFAAWLGIASIGGVVALLNTNLKSNSLAHCINVADPLHLIVEAPFRETIISAIPELNVSPVIWTHGVSDPRFRRIDPEVQQQLRGPVDRRERPALTVEDKALLIYTSGTTGLPKAAHVGHARVLQWSYWFAGMMDVQPADRMYSCLPMYHSIGGVQVPGAAMVAGSSVVLREKFSAGQFWSDVVRWDCSMFQYIGEFCRYLLHAEPSPHDRAHRIRLACGNGLAPDVWKRFQERFSIPRILEFYASTEGGVSLFNAEGEPGAIGRIPPYLRHRFSPALVRLDVETGQPLRDDQGRCIRCAPNEIGEALGQVLSDAANIGSRFEGYSDPEASRKKLLCDVFEPGDAWVRTGDLMREDERGFFRFVDRIGDTFRWKGENVATTEVAEALCAFPGVNHASVYGVSLPGAEGRAGMAAIGANGDLDLEELRSHLVSRLPSYARPVFLRLQPEVEVTGTFKYSKTELVKQGYNPAATDDPVFFHHPETQAFVRLDRDLYSRIQSGGLRL